MMETASSLESSADFDAYYQQYKTPIYRTIRGIVIDDGLAQELTHDVFMKAWKWQQTGRAIDSMGAWLRRVAVNAAVSHLRRQKLAKLLPMRLFTGTVSSEFDQAEDRALVLRALATLTPKLRVVVMLHFYERMTRQEIADLLRIPPGTVASRLGDAMIKMRKALDSTDPDGMITRLKGSAS